MHPTSRTASALSFVLGPGMIAALLALTIMGPMASDAVLPGFPAIATEYGTTPDRVQLTITASTFGAAIGQLILGTLSDAWGRRRLLLVGSFAMIIGSAAAALAPSIDLLIAASFVNGLASAAGLALGRAVLADILDEGHLVRAYSLWGVVIGVTPMFAAVGGAVVVTYLGWRPVFWVLAALGAITWLLTLIWVPETLPPARRTAASVRSFAANLSEVLHDRVFIAASFIVWFGFAAVFAYMAASPFILQTMLGFTPTQFAVVIAVDGVGLMITGAIAARLGPVLSPRALLSIGLSVAALGATTAVFAVTTNNVNAVTMIASIWLLGCSMGFVFGSAAGLAIARLGHIAGTALAVQGAVQFLFAGLAAPLVGLAGEYSAAPYAIVVTVCVVGGWIALAATGSRSSDQPSVESPDSTGVEQSDIH